MKKKQKQAVEILVKTLAMIFIAGALGISLYIMVDSFKDIFKDVVKIEIIKK
jgi:hypothetical protein